MAIVTEHIKSKHPWYKKVQIFGENKKATWKEQWTENARSYIYQHFNIYANAENRSSLVSR